MSLFNLFGLIGVVGGLLYLATKAGKAGVKAAPTTELTLPPGCTAEHVQFLKDVVKAIKKKTHNIVLVTKAIPIAKQCGFMELATKLEAEKHGFRMIPPTS